MRLKLYSLGKDFRLEWKTMVFYLFFFRFWKVQNLPESQISEFHNLEVFYSITEINISISDSKRFKIQNWNGLNLLTKWFNYSGILANFNLQKPWTCHPVSCFLEFLEWVRWHLPNHNEKCFLHKTHWWLQDRWKYESQNYISHWKKSLLQYTSVGWTSLSSMRLIR